MSPDLRLSGAREGVMRSSGAQRRIESARLRDKPMTATANGDQRDHDDSRATTRLCRLARDDSPVTTACLLAHEDDSSGAWMIRVQPGDDG